MNCIKSVYQTVSSQGFDPQKRMKVRSWQPLANGMNLACQAIIPGLRSEYVGSNLVVEEVERGDSDSSQAGSSGLSLD